ncbi:MAG TPA: hypothetical protein VFW18_06070 [Gaiellales bacterium]|nr:hypothetical protein [Gaiellales bacterium]
MRAAALALAAITALTFPASAAAHVLLSPNTAAPHSFMLYTVLSPNERESPLTGLALTIPESLEVDAVADTPGFTESEITDPSHRIVGLRWSGGRIAPGKLALFHFTGSVGDAGTIHLTGVQTFANGTTEVWHTPQIVVGAAAGSSGDSSSSDTLARALSGVAVVLAAIAVVIAWRRR